VCAIIHTPISKITIPAVKITGAAPTFPILPDDTMLSPEPCLSDTAKLDPIDSALFPNPMDDAVAVLSGTDEEEDVVEFGEFLLDAVDWL
jgi:hypothetical protein